MTAAELGNRKRSGLCFQSQNLNWTKRVHKRSSWLPVDGDRAVAVVVTGIKQQLVPQRGPV